MPGGSDSKRICLSFRRPGFDPWLGKITWRRTWQPTSVFLPGESHGQRSLVGYSPWGHRIGHNLATKYSAWEESLPTLDPISRPTHFSEPLSLLLVLFLPLQFPLFLPLVKTNKQTPIHFLWLSIRPSLSIKLPCNFFIWCSLSLFFKCPSTSVIHNI